jgi:hypothetical protein
VVLVLREGTRVLRAQVFYRSNPAREAFVEMCESEYVQRMTFDSYLYKTVVPGARAVHCDTAFSATSFLFALQSAQGAQAVTTLRRHCWCMLAFLPRMAAHALLLRSQHMHVPGNTLVKGSSAVSSSTVP